MYYNSQLILMLSFAIFAHAQLYIVEMREIYSIIFGEERLIGETVPSINPDRNRSQAEARNSQVKRFDSSAPNLSHLHRTHFSGSDNAAKRASSFSETFKDEQCFQNVFTDGELNDYPFKHFSIFFSIFIFHTIFLFDQNKTAN